MTDHTQRHSQLVARLAELRARLVEIDEELDSHQSKDWTELATERESDEMLESMGQAGQQEIAKIEAALVRFDRGDYGICQKCGDQISDARLDVLPYTPLCKSCAAESADQRK